MKQGRLRYLIDKYLTREIKANDHGTLVMRRRAFTLKELTRHINASGITQFTRKEVAAELARMPGVATRLHRPTGEQLYKTPDLSDIIWCHGASQRAGDVSYSPSISRI